MYAISSRAASVLFLLQGKYWMTLLLHGLVVGIGIMLAAPSRGATVPAGFDDREVASGFASPTAMTILPDGRVLVVEQDGVIRMIKDDVLLDASFHAVQNVDTFAERGCLGATPDPDFASNQHVYLYCTVKTGEGSRNRVLRVTASGDVALQGSEQTILELPNVPAGVQWHMGGPMRFGPDGKLYIGVGGHEDLRHEPPEASFSQSLAVPFGKILRINPDGSFPADNPFFNTPGAYRGIFALGLRNPYAIDTQPGTGLLYINDVGAGSFEEINQAAPRANYAWPLHEGRSDNPRFTNAVHEYGRDTGCAITGGTFYNPRSTQFPAAYVGKYLFSDYCGGWIRVFDPANPGRGAQEFVTGIDSPVAIATAPDGSVYYLARNQQSDAQNPGSLGKIIFTNSQSPRLTQQPQGQTVFLGEPVTFTVAADGAARYQWRRNGADIPGATSASYTIAQTALSDNQAVFTVVVSNGLGSTTSSAAILTVTNNRLPTASITAPASSVQFAPGDQIAYAGTASDVEDGALPPAAFTWKVDFMHDTHAHPFYPATSGAADGAFTVPSFDAEAANIWLRLSLSVKDSANQVSTAVRDIYPQGLLADMAPSGTPANGNGPVEINRNNGGAAPGDGGVIMLDRIGYAKGLGVHAPSEIRYQLGGACTGHFIADVGIDDVASDQGSVIFQVYLDDAKVFDSALMRGDDLRKAIHAGVTGKQQLRLVVTDGGDGNAADLANWAGARVTGCPVSLPAATASPPAPGGSASGAENSVGAPIAPPVAGSGGGGCAIASSGRFDPILPGLLALSIGVLGWRGRRRRR
ncbi:MAG TPA: PQQ-dependent sugar dehydrogenase [Noviherbaspirillum sp.]